MPFFTEYDSERDIVIHRGSGVINLNEIIAQLEVFFRDTPNKNAIWDLSDADVSHLRTEDMISMMSFVQEHAALRADGRTAWVAPSDANYGISRMTEMWSDGLPYQRRAFRTMEEAVGWLTQAERDIP